MIVYVDKENKCHVETADGLTAVEHEFFDNKCDTLIEGYCYEEKDNVISIYPWKPSDELDAAQREYERELLAELQANSLSIADLEAAYQEGVNSAYD